MAHLPASTPGLDWRLSAVARTRSVQRRLRPVAVALMLYAVIALVAGVLQFDATVGTGGSLLWLLWWWWSAAVVGVLAAGFAIAHLVLTRLIDHTAPQRREPWIDHYG